MDRVIALVMASSGRRQRYDDDAVDRLHHRYTVLIIVVFALVVGMQHYIGQPVTCWAPAHFKGAWVKYSNNYCWVKDTYHLPYENEIPREEEHEKRREIIYYQWIPFILILQAVLFYLPCQVWRSLNSKAGVDSDNILEAAEKFSHAIKAENKERTLVLITNQIDRFVASPRGGGKGKHKFRITSLICGILTCGKKFGNYLVLLYITVKLLYIANVFFQLFMLNTVLKTRYDIYGLEAVKNVLENRNFINNTVFPKVTMCDFKIRILGNVQRYTLQCLLPINLYTEKMYVFLWWWMVLMLFASFSNFLIWIVRAILSSDRLSYIRSHLEVIERLPDETERAFSKDFTYSYLKQDGVFILRMIGHNTNQIALNEILASLWDNWRRRQKEPIRRNGQPKKYSLFRDDDEDMTMPLKKMKMPPPPPPPPTSKKPKVPPKPSNASYRPNPSAPPDYAPLKQQPSSLDQPDGEGNESN